MLVAQPMLADEFNGYSGTLRRLADSSSLSGSQSFGLVVQHGKQWLQGPLWQVENLLADLCIGSICTATK